MQITDSPIPRGVKRGVSPDIIRLADLQSDVKELISIYHILFHNDTVQAFMFKEEQGRKRRSKRKPNVEIFWLNLTVRCIFLCGIVSLVVAS